MHTKSRGGCLRCKSKKTKCDERKPGCARCEERGFQCPGYALNVRWSRKHQVRVDQKGATRGSPRQSSLDGSVSQRRLQQAEATSPASNQIGADVLQLVDPWLTSPFQWDLPALHQEIPSFDASSCALLLGSQEAVPTTPSWDIPFVSSAWTVDGQSPTTSSSQGEDRQVEQSFPMNGTPTIIVQDNSTRPQVEIAQPRPSQQVLESNLCELSHLPTSLSEYFFREVITLYCAWDSKTNVMRNIVETMWQSSGALYHTIQSMAAACLSEDFPHLLPVARREHGNALRLIRDRPPALPKSTSMTTTHKRAMLLSSTLLGHTSSWFSPQNLATDMFRASCSMLKDVSAETSSDADASLSFFSDTMDYWAMLLAYLTDSNQLGDYHHTNSIGPTDPSKSIEPHPYSGISHATVRLLTDTGILIFQYRKHMATVKFLTETDLDVFRAALRSARKFERALLAHRPPDLSRVTDPGDPKTPLRHLELIDEAYRCTGLLQLYRVFPDLLNERYAPWDRERLLRPVPMPEAATGGLDGHKVPSARERRTWLTKLAIYILGILRDIPFESRTRSAQPFIMVAISNELRRDPQHLRQPDAACSDMGADVLDIDPASIEVARARKFVRSRLAAYTHILPLRKSRVISELIDHTWAALDAGEEDVYWLDIAREKNLVTMMG